ncbi:MAG: hypothetical protein JSS72_02830 [Armatimonadetes bacterium]|nr:hypothetical protein [Armatimonadota bacterium]
MIPALAITALLLGQRANLYEPVKARDQLEIPMTRYLTRDRFGRTISFYITNTADPSPRPVLLFVQDRGAASVVRKPDHLEPVSGEVVKTFGDVFRVVIVEKPGVILYDDPIAEQAAGSEWFRREHTLERWTECLAAVLKASSGIAGVKSGAATAVGLGEGALAAASLAATTPDIRQVVVVGAGAGGKLQDLMASAMRGEFGEERGTSDAMLQKMLIQWDAMRTHPDETRRAFAGQSYHQWAEFGIPNLSESLLALKQPVIIVSGDEDVEVSKAGIETLFTMLRARRGDVRWIVAEMAPHSLLGKWSVVKSALANQR